MSKPLVKTATVLFVAITVVAAGGGTAVAAASTVSQNPGPYAAPGCLAVEPQNDLQNVSVNYLNSEVEPQVSVDPTNAARLVGVWQQDRWTNGGAHGLVAGYSANGGVSWTVSPQPFRDLEEGRYGSLARLELDRLGIRNGSA